MEHTKTYQEFKKNGNTKFVRYSEGAEMYHMSVSKFMQMAKDAKATPALFGDVLEYEGKFYKVGTVRQEVKDTKVEDDSFYLLTLAAVAKELKRRGLAEAKVFLAVGLVMFLCKFIIHQKVLYDSFYEKSCKVVLLIYK